MQGSDRVQDMNVTAANDAISGVRRLRRES